VIKFPSIECHGSVFAVCIQTNGTASKAHGEVQQLYGCAGRSRTDERSVVRESRYSCLALTVEGHKQGLISDVQVRHAFRGDHVNIARQLWGAFGMTDCK
jgi:hypothetical protein